MSANGSNCLIVKRAKERGRTKGVYDRSKTVGLQYINWPGVCGCNCSCSSGGRRESERSLSRRQRVAGAKQVVVSVELRSAILGALSGYPLPLEADTVGCNAGASVNLCIRTTEWPLSGILRTDQDGIQDGVVYESGISNALDQEDPAKSPAKLAESGKRSHGSPLATPPHQEEL